MFETEAEQVAGAARYEPKEGRKAYRAGHYERSLTVRPAA
jgi:transposase-like protein